MIKILHTEWSDGFGGQERRVLAEIIGLRQRGYSVSLSCRRNSVIREYAEKYGIRTYLLPFRSLYDIRSIFLLLRVIKKEMFDIVNTHSSVDSWIGGIAAKLAKVPIIIRTRHLDIPCKRDVLHFIHYLPDMYITCGETMRKNLIEKGKFPSDKIISIPTGISEDFFNVKRDLNAKIKYGLDKTSIVITNVGILRKVKGHKTTLQAVKSVVRHFPNAKFLIVGDGPYRKNLEELTDILGIKQYVIFTGFIDNIPEIYSFADVAILTSWSEGIPQSILQAMAAGVPVVSTEVGGVPEVIKQEKTGLLVKPGDYEALAGCIVRILRNPTFAAALAKNAKEFVKRDYSVECMLDKIEDLYAHLLKK
ncbi:MAG: glycosyltransferase family 4 protein [Candidatus Omnitrophica bacterium]|nr:glycosyltransferase family 4 protein [Candidatus Omnitrophota bacterium]